MFGSFTAAIRFTSQFVAFISVKCWEIYRTTAIFMVLALSTWRIWFESDSIRTAEVWVLSAKLSCQKLGRIINRQQLRVLALWRIIVVAW